MGVPALPRHERMTDMTLFATRITGAAFGLALAMLAGPGLATEKTGLAAEKEINDALVIIAAAEKIQRECGSIGGRLFRARSYGERVVDIAVSKGYTEDEIRAFVDDDAEKARVRAERNAYFAARGASNTDPDSLCVLGRDEIARNSPIGYFLREK
jgi:hypothetical protein